MEMSLRSLGRTGLMISPIGLGTVKLGRNQGLKHPGTFELPTDNEAKRLLDCARDLGINFLDTAAAYGESEARLGHLLHGRRQDWIICTKAGEEFEAGQSRFDFTPEHMRASVERSLRRLRGDYLDLVLVHSDGNDRDLIERYGTLQALQELKQAGLIRACGVSTKTLDGGLLLAQYADALMVACNPLDREQLPVIEACRQLGTGVLVKKALASGHLCTEAADNTDPVQTSLDFLFAQPGVDSVVIGTLNPEHLRENVAKALKALVGQQQNGPDVSTP
jgi:aryl-alcohol dehydrogenase-like predicted oxidoreductase